MKIDRLVRVTKKRIATVHRQPSWNGSLVRKRDSQRSSSWSSIREHCPCYWNRNWRSYWWDSRTDFGKSEEKKDSKWFTITPHCAHRSDGLCAIFPPEPQNHTPYPLKTAQNGADDFWGRESLCSRLPGVRFQCDPYLTAKKQKIWLSRKRWTGRQFIAESWKRWRGIGAQPWPGSKGMKSLCKDLDKRQSAKRLYIHRVALLPLNLRTVSPIYGETSKCALLLFWFYKFRSQSQLTCLV